jgi:hypothetical protein
MKGRSRKIAGMRRDAPKSAGEAEKITGMNVE